MTTPKINHDRLMQRLEALAQITDPARPYTRRSFTDTYRRGREWLAEEMRAAGLEVSLDAGGNLVGKLSGRSPGPPVVVGSHIDTVLDGGRFDGTLGVLAGLEIAQTLRENDVVLERDLLVVDFLAEEVSEFGISCIGSRAMAGMLSSAMLNLTAPSGTTLSEAIAEFGGNPSEIVEGQPLLESHAGYLELHIEQGPALEAAGKTIGIVTGIVGINRYRIEVVGEARHAGTTPMDLRVDALAAAGKILYSVNRLARDATRETPLVATIGNIHVHPNQGNVIPGRVELALEVRSQDSAAIEGLLQAIGNELSSVDAELGTSSSLRQLSVARATDTDATLADLLKRSAVQLGHEYLELPSGAGHDAVYMAAIGPMAMVFVPSVGGVSHHFREFTAVPDVCVGAELVCTAAVTLAEEIVAKISQR